MIWAVCIFFRGHFGECFIHFIKFCNNELLILLIFFSVVFAVCDRCIVTIVCIVLRFGNSSTLKNTKEGEKIYESHSGCKLLYFSSRFIWYTLLFSDLKYLFCCILSSFSCHQWEGGWSQSLGAGSGNLCGVLLLSVSLLSILWVHQSQKACILFLLVHPLCLAKHLGHQYMVLEVVNFLFFSIYLMQSS